MGAVLDHVRSRPLRTWSIVITVFGDVVVPRGGAISMGSLLNIFAGLGIGAGVVRTAVSRLSADGWLDGVRARRSSTYRLTAKAQESSTLAAERIYGSPPVWDGMLRVVFAGPGECLCDPDSYGEAAPGVWISPRPIRPSDRHLPSVEGQASLETARELANRAWPPEVSAPAYQQFLTVFTPVQEWLTRQDDMADYDALLLRILLVHEYRRAVLRDPAPSELRPAGWVGAQARALCREAYRAVLPGAERWLDQFAQAEDGTLPPAQGLAGRF